MCYIIKKNWGRNINKVIHLEKETYKEVLKFYKLFINDITEYLNKNIKNKDLTNDILKIAMNSLKKLWTTDKLKTNFLKSAKLWTEYLNKTINLGIWFWELEPEIVKYFTEIDTQFMWNPRETTWIITNLVTAVNDIIKIWALEWTSPKLIADIIKDSWVVSQSRAEMIAVNQMGRGYEIWKKETINKFISENPGTKILKKWVTVWDSRVTESHKQNAKDGWIDVNLSFSWTRDQIAPASDNPRCRCSVVYKVE